MRWCPAHPRHGLISLPDLNAGEALEWRDDRRAMANGDKTFAAMAAVRPDAIPKKRLPSLTLLVENPAFAVEQLRPVCMAAARIAEWITRVVRCVVPPEIRSPTQSVYVCVYCVRAWGGGGGTGNSAAG